MPHIGNLKKVNRLIGKKDGLKVMEHKFTEQMKLKCTGSSHWSLYLQKVI